MSTLLYLHYCGGMSTLLYLHKQNGEWVLLSHAKAQPCAFGGGRGPCDEQCTRGHTPPDPASPSPPHPLTLGIPHRLRPLPPLLAPTHWAAPTPTFPLPLPPPPARPARACHPGAPLVHRPRGHGPLPPRPHPPPLAPPLLRPLLCSPGSALRVKPQQRPQQGQHHWYWQGQRQCQRGRPRWKEGQLQGPG